MNKHTPGPWRVASDQNSVGDTVWAGDLPVAICSPVRVFLASKQTVQFTGAEASANARLIAAAPMMYEALKELMEYAGIIEERCDAVATNKARAAIKAVEGAGA